MAKLTKIVGFRATTAEVAQLKRVTKPGATMSQTIRTAVQQYLQQQQTQGKPGQ